MACLYQTAATDAIRLRPDVEKSGRLFEEQLAGGSGRRSQTAKRHALSAGAIPAAGREQHGGGAEAKRRGCGWG